MQLKLTLTCAALFICTGCTCDHEMASSARDTTTTRTAYIAPGELGGTGRDTMNDSRACGNPSRDDRYGMMGATDSRSSYDRDRSSDYRSSDHRSSDYRSSDYRSTKESGSTDKTYTDRTSTRSGEERVGGVSRDTKADDRYADGTAKTGTRDETRSMGMVSGNEEFLRHVAKCDQKEIDVSRQALTQARDTRVREFAQRMVNEHEKCSKEAKELARTKNISIPEDTSNPKVPEKLSSLSGEAFDREYVEMMVHDHIKTVKKFESQARSASDPEVRAFAERKLPMLREHLQQARALANDLGVKIDEERDWDHDR